MIAAAFAAGLPSVFSMPATPPRRQAPAKIDAKLRSEIEEHNAEVDRKRAEKLARKKARQ